MGSSGDVDLAVALSSGTLAHAEAASRVFAPCFKNPVLAQRQAQIPNCPAVGGSSLADFLGLRAPVGWALRHRHRQPGRLAAEKEHDRARESGADTAWADP